MLRLARIDAAGVLHHVIIGGKIFRAHKILEIAPLLLWFCSVRSAESMSYLRLISANLFLREPYGEERCLV